MRLRQATTSEFVTSGDAARLLLVSKQHLHRLVEAGQLTAAIRAANGYLLFTRDEVERLRSVRHEMPPRRGPKPGTSRAALRRAKRGSGTKRK